MKGKEKARVQKSDTETKLNALSTRICVCVCVSISVLHSILKANTALAVQRLMWCSTDVLLR